MAKTTHKSTSILQDQRTVLDHAWGKGSNLLTGGFAKGTAVHEPFDPKLRAAKSVIGLKSVR